MRVQSDCHGKTCHCDAKEPVYICKDEMILCRCSRHMNGFHVKKEYVNVEELVNRQRAVKGV